MDFWDNKFSSKEYIYGEKPNMFFKEEIEKLNPGTLLLPAEGEGRNAVFACQLGWKVLAFDNSFNAKEKAENLARKNNVTFEYQQKTFYEFDYKHNFFDCIGLIFTHVNADYRRTLHKKLLKYVKPGGSIILEGFSKKQLNYNSGGPKNIEMLFSAEDLKKDFKSLSKLKIEEVEISLHEGNHHRGIASVINLVGIK